MLKGRVLLSSESSNQELQPSKSLERDYDLRQDTGQPSSPTGRQVQHYRSLQVGNQVASTCRLALPGTPSQQRDNKRWHTAPKEKHKVRQITRGSSPLPRMIGRIRETKVGKAFTSRDTRRYNLKSAGAWAEEVLTDSRTLCRVGGRWIYQRTRFDRP
jgi:hypothetical protein